MVNRNIAMAVICFWAGVSGDPVVAGDVVSDGISVSVPKVYEERTLRAMLAEAESQLAAIRPISSAKIEQAVGNIQGGSQTTTGFSLTAQGVAQPAGEFYEERTMNTSGELTTSKVTEKTTPEKAVAAIPSDPTIAALTTEGFGLSARDLLAEQTALTYQVASLRLALERATSDRLNNLKNRDGGAEVTVSRYPIVLGFTIGIDRPKKDSVAEVGITLNLKGSELKPRVTSPPGISLVSVLPARESYNVAAITDKQASIGAGQIVSVVQIGARFLRSRKTYYIVRDIDTIATLKSPSKGNPNQIEIGWQFRPVLGRKTVDPGPRQVFVVLTIDDDRYDTDLTLSAKASTRWAKIKSNGVFAASQPTVAGEIELGVLGYWQIFTKEALAPFLRKTTLTPLSSDRALVTLSGSFLSPESRILVGDKTIDRSSGLAFSDETGLSFVIPLKDLGQADDLYLINRFLQPAIVRRDASNPARPLKLVSKNCSEKRKPGLDGCCSAQHIEGTDRYRIVADLTSEELPKLEDLIAVVGDLVVTGANPVGFDGRWAIRLSSLPMEETESPTTSVSFDLPAEAIRKSPDLTIREVFGGPERAVQCRLPILPFVEKVSVVSRNRDSATLALQGRGLTALKKVLLGDSWVSFKQSSETIAIFQAKWEQLAGVESLVIGSENEIQQVVALKEKPELKKPVISTKPEVAEGYSGVIEIEGDNLESIRKVLFEGLELRKEMEGKKMKIILVTQVTAKAASRSLTLELLDGSEVLLPVVVKASAAPST